jgi:predicted dehydrogenase
MTERERLKLAVIGVGWVVRELHLPALERTGVGEVVATADPSPGLRATFSSHREMLARTRCDAVLIASPPALHREHALDALNAGLHVLLEKPMAAALEDAEAIREAARTAKRVCALGFNQRCHPAFMKLRGRIARGELGEVRSVRAVWSTNTGYSAREWLGRRGTGGGALLDLGSHQLDLWRYLLGADPLEVTADSESRILDDENARLEARFPGGIHCTAALSLVGGDRFEVEVEGSRRRTRIRPYGRAFRSSYDEQWRRFAHAVREGAPPAASADDGVAALALLLEAARDLPVAPVPETAEPRYPLSAIASTATGYKALRTTIAHLRAQTVAARMELVLVGPSLEALEHAAEDAAPFAAVQKVAVGPVRSIAHANAAGVRRARGRVVVLTEDHCFPEPGWAAALLRAHEEPWAAVGPVVRNANPGSVVSWADFLIGYGPWMEPAPAHSPAFLPGHNSSYKRELLLALGGRLEAMLESETVLHFEWTTRGLPLRIEPAARVAHVNFSRWRSWLPVQFLWGRLFAGMRAASWPRRRRWFYAAASPLIPAVRFWRAVRAYLQPGRSRWLLLRTAPVLALGLTLDGLGQMLGYLRGPGRSMETLARYEFNRIEHVRAEDRRLWHDA